MAYVCYLNSDQVIIEGVLFAEQLEIDIKGSTIFKIVEKF